MTDASAAGQGAMIHIPAVIPTLNEAKNIGHVLRAMPTCLDEVIIVDGQSLHRAVEAARAVRPDVRVVRQVRRGKGNALAAGVLAARGKYVVLLDAEGSMAPDEVDRLVEVLDQRAQYVKGSRFHPEGASDDITRLRALNGLIHVLSGTRFTDCATARTPYFATARRRDEYRRDRRWSRFRCRPAGCGTTEVRRGGCCRQDYGVRLRVGPNHAEGTLVRLAIACQADECGT